MLSNREIDKTLGAIFLPVREIESDNAEKMLGFAIIFCTIMTIDYLTPNVNAGILYVIPLSATVWTEGILTGFIFSILCASITIIINSINGGTLFNKNPLSNYAIHLVSYLTLCYFVYHIKAHYKRELHRASFDCLTGGYTKDAIYGFMAACLGGKAKTERDLLLVYVDLDGFKQVNDAFGHSVGDKVLSEFSAGISRNLHEGERFGRLGGDEFIIVIQLKTKTAAETRARHLHERLTYILKSVGYPVTCSMGALVVSREANQPCPELLDQVDKLMYAAKRTGKNRFVFAVVPSHSPTSGTENHAHHHSPLCPSQRSGCANTPTCPLVRSVQC